MPNPHEIEWVLSDIVADETGIISVRINGVLFVPKETQ
jgi:hypothetical protein